MRQKKRNERRRSSFLARGRGSTAGRMSGGSFGGKGSPKGSRSKSLPVKGSPGTTSSTSMRERRNSISNQLKEVGKVLAKTVSGTNGGAFINPAETETDSAGRRATKDEAESMNWYQDYSSMGRNNSENNYFSSGRISNMTIHSRYSDF